MSTAQTTLAEVRTHVTLRLAARVFGFTHGGLRVMAQRGELPGAVKCGSRWRVKAAVLCTAWGVDLEKSFPGISADRS